MDNMEANNKQNMNSAGESDHFCLDQMGQAKDDFSRPHKGSQSLEIVHSANRTMPATDATLLFRQSRDTAEPTQAVQSGSDIIKSMFRFKWMILTIFILVAAPVIAFTWTQIVPEYQARAQVRVRPIIPYLVFRTEDSGMIPFYSSFVNTQVSIMRDSTVLRRALDRYEVKETQWYKEPTRSFIQQLLGNPPLSHLERLRDGLSVRPVKETEIIAVAFINRSPKEASIILDIILDEYIKYISEKSDASQDELYSRLLEQYKSLDNEIKGQEIITAELSKSLGTESPQELVSSNRIRLDGIQVRLSELQQNIAVLEWEQKKLEDLAKQTIADGNNVLSKQTRYFEDAEWRSLDINVRTLKYKIASSLITPKHQGAAQFKKDLEFAEELLRLREEQLDLQWRDSLIDSSNVPITTTYASDSHYKEELKSLEFKLARTKYEEQLLLAKFKKQQVEFQELFENAQLLENEYNTLQHKRELYSAVRERLDQKNMERNVPGSIEVLARASVSSEPYNDRRIVLTAMAVFLGFGIGGGLAFFRASRNQTIYAPKDIPRFMQVPFLGYIPVTGTRKSSYDKDNSAVIESVRFVRTALLSCLDSQGNTAVLVTSADAGTGKSTFVTMLGKSIAQAGKKVLIIDADFRKMTLTKRFNLSDKSGFLDSLYNKSIDKRYIFPTETFGLSIIPVGKPRNDLSVFEGTANGAFKACMSQLRKKYDIILLDSSPILPVADATILSGQVDGTIMVERELISQRENVINALARLSSAGGRLLGTVFVGSSSQEGYKYSYHYGKTIDY